GAGGSRVYVRSRVGRREPGQDAECQRLARARWTEHCQTPALGGVSDVEREAVEISRDRKVEECGLTSRQRRSLWGWELLVRGTPATGAEARQREQNQRGSESGRDRQHCRRQAARVELHEREDRQRAGAIRP